MATKLDAVYENGVFRPLQPVQLPEHFRVHVTIDDASAPYDSVDERAHFQLPPDRWQAFCEALDASPKDIAALRQLLTKPSVLDEQQPTAH